MPDQFSVFYVGIQHYFSADIRSRDNRLSRTCGSLTYVQHESVFSNQCYVGTLSIKAIPAPRMKDRHHGTDLTLEDYAKRSIRVSIAVSLGNDRVSLIKLTEVLSVMLWQHNIPVKF